ncbi:MAG: hypothetical protein Q8N47_09765 [Bryobacterales bacterium]|nr:hypothetical protein [Bryobacterales bacterium]
MGIIVKFVSGEEREYDGDAAALCSPVFVLYKYNRKRRKLESGQTFLADEVVLARLANGSIVLGEGRVK